MSLRDLFNLFRGDARRVVYSNDGRSGCVWYCEGLKRVPFAFEFGGGDCVAIVYVPTVETWMAATHLPLERRDDVLAFTAQCVLRDQLSGAGRVEIGADALTFFER